MPHDKTPEAAKREQALYDGLTQAVETEPNTIETSAGGRARHRAITEGRLKPYAPGAVESAQAEVAVEAIEADELEQEETAEEIE